MSSPNNLEAMADQYGMVDPKKAVYLFPDGRTVEVPWDGESGE
ncbi:hypothetical protein GCM10029992_41020 [Glycomyces albus]